MLRFLDNGIRRDNSYTEKVQYSVNGVSCLRENCSQLIKKTSGDHGSVIIKKSVERKNTQGRFAKTKFKLSLDCSTIKRVLSMDKANYDSLIALLLKTLDSAVSAIIDFGNHFEQFEKDTMAYLMFLNKFKIDPEVPELDDISAMLSKMGCLFTVNLVYSFSQCWITKAGFKHFEQYGNDAFPKIDLPSIPMDEGALWDLVSAKTFLQKFLDNYSTIKMSLEENVLCYPPARSFALKTVEELYDLANNYMSVFEDCPGLSITSNSMM